MVGLQESCEEFLGARAKIAPRRATVKPPRSRWVPVDRARREATLRPSRRSGCSPASVAGGREARRTGN